MGTPRHHRRDERLSVLFASAAILVSFGCLLALSQSRSGDKGAIEVSAERPTQAPADDDGPDLSYDELLEKLRGQGLEIHLRPLRPGKTGVLYVFADDPLEADRLAAVYRSGTGQAPVVSCSKYKTAKESAQDKGSKTSFPWGRFRFWGHPDTTALSKMQKALTGKTTFPPFIPQPPLGKHPLIA